MKKLLILLAVGAVVVPVLVFSIPPVPPIPHTINYQGMLTDNLGNPLNGTPDITFEIWNAPSGGTKRWWEIQSNVPVEEGLFNVILGEVTPIDLSFYEDEEYWLQIIVEEDTMPSRLEFTSVAFAYRAQMADTALYAVGVPEGDLDDRYVNVNGPDSIRGSSSSQMLRVKNYGSGDAIYIYAATSTAGDGIDIDSAGDHGIEIANTGDDGIYLDDIHQDGIYMMDTDDDGIQMYRIGDDGIYMDNIGDVGIYMDDVADDGIWLNDIEDNGIYINDAADNGLYVKKADYGIYIDSARASYDGIWINKAGDEGIHVSFTGGNGVYVNNAGNDGLSVNHADHFGLYIYDSDDDGIRVASADRDGIEAHGGNRGGNFYSGSASYYGVTAHSYNSLSTNLGLWVYGTAYSTGGWSKSVPGSSGDVPAFSVCSPDVELIVSGTGTLVGGKAEIAFEQTFQEAISPEIPVKVVLTAQGAPSGLLYVASKSNQGFSVERLEIPDLAMKSGDITFDWIAIARQKGYEQRPEVIMEEESVADQLSREEEMRAEELRHQEELERHELHRQQMLEKQARKEAERREEEKEREEESTD